MASVLGPQGIYPNATQNTLTQNCAFIILGRSVKLILFSIFHYSYVEKGTKAQGESNG